MSGRVALGDETQARSLGDRRCKGTLEGQEMAVARVGWGVASSHGLSPPTPLPSAWTPAILCLAGLCGDRALPSNSCHGEPLSEVPTIDQRLRLPLSDRIQRKGRFIARPGRERIWAFNMEAAEHGAATQTTGQPCPRRRQEAEQMRPSRAARPLFSFNWVNMCL